MFVSHTCFPLIFARKTKYEFRTNRNRCEAGGIALKKSFNPAFYVSFSPEGEKDLDLSAKLLWFQHVHPGWRIVSDGMDVVAYDNGSGSTETMLLGHVAIIDEKGVRVLSVPSSVSVTEFGGDDSALEFFQSGASVALDMLGMTVYNITREQWSEYWSFKREASGDDAVSPPRSSLPSASVRGPVSETAAAAAEEPDVFAEIDDDDVLRLFRDVVINSPSEIPAYSPGARVDEEGLRVFFDRFCLAEVGSPWDMADEVERGHIKKRMMELVGKRA